MAIYKSNQVGNFTTIPNEIFKAGLSLEAIGLITYLLSLPPNWVVHKTFLPSQLKTGRERLFRAFKELQDAGYILSVKNIDKKGKFRYEHIVYDKPYNGEPLTDNRIRETVNGKPSTENRTLIKKQVIKNSNKERVIKKENIPALYEVEDYFTQKGYTIESAVRFFDYYNVGNWSDSKGNKVRNWKQKAHAVWFKPENKIQEKQTQSVSGTTSELAKKGIYLSQ